MSENRRRQPSGSGPRGRSGPGRSSGRDHDRGRARTTERAGGRATVSPGGGTPARGGREARTGRGGPAATERPARPRLTGRAAILVIVLAVLAVSYASSLRAYLQQRDHIGDLQATITEREGAIDELTEERELWKSPQYVRAQARARLGYVSPGETPFVALRDGEPIEGESLDEPGVSTTTVPPAWYDSMWESAKVAGDPPLTSRPPLTRIDGTSASEE